MANTLDDEHAAHVASIIPTGGIVLGHSDTVGADPIPGPTDEQFQALVEGMPQLVWRSCDMGNWTWSSPQWLAFTGQTQEQSHGRGWMEAVHPDDRAATMDAWAKARPNGLLDAEFRVREDATGNYVWHHTRSAPAFDAEHRIVEWLGTTTNIHDMKLLQLDQVRLLSEAETHAHELEAEIQERRRTEEKLLYTAFHDDLTGLHNRAFLMGQLRRLLAGHGASNGAATLLVLDLNRFKLVNSSLGHGAGDVLLTSLARRLRRCLAPDDTLARLGGDEFAILVEQSEDVDVPELATRLMEAVRRPFSLGRRQVVSSCSIGVTRVSRQHAAPEDVLREADAALHLAKREEPGRFLMFEPEMRESTAELLDLRSDLKDAAARSEFELQYQPIWGLASSGLVGFEALLRWNNPRLGRLQPDAFIPIAEETGVIREIGQWVLREACGQLRRWSDQHPGHTVTMSVNVCGEELKNPGYLPQLRKALADFDLSPDLLELEITEGVLLEHSETVLQTLATLRALNVKIAIDDFGTGFSSLSYLDRYEVDTVKIDRSFVSRLLTERRTRSILQAITGLGHALSLRVVAEGVETEEQLEALRAIECDAVQGYLTGRPALPADLVPVLEAARLMPAGPG